MLIFQAIVSIFTVLIRIVIRVWSRGADYRVGDHWNLISGMKSISAVTRDSWPRNCKIARTFSGRAKKKRTNVHFQRVAVEKSMRSVEAERARRSEKSSFHRSPFHHRRSSLYLPLECVVCIVTSDLYLQSLDQRKDQSRFTVDKIQKKN